MATNETAFIDRVRDTATRCIDLSNDFAALAGEWTHRHYATELTAEHFGGANQDVTPEQVQAVMGALGVILGGDYAGAKRRRVRGEGVRARRIATGCVIIYGVLMLAASVVILGAVFGYWSLP